MGTMHEEEWVEYESYQMRKNASTKELYVGSEKKSLKHIAPNQSQESRMWVSGGEHDNEVTRQPMTHWAPRLSLLFKPNADAQCTSQAMDQSFPLTIIALILGEINTTYRNDERREE